MINKKLERILNEGKATFVDRPGRKLAHVKVETPKEDNEELIKKLEDIGVINGKKARKKLKKKIKLSKRKISKHKAKRIIKKLKKHSYDV